MSVDPDAARETAREILHGGTTRTDSGPRPLRGVLEWLGDRLRPIGGFFADIWDDLYALFDFFTWVLLFAVIAGVIALVARSRHERLGAVSTRGPGAEPERQLNADDLEREAARREALGEHRDGVRLRFRAGLLRLDHDAHAIVYRDGIGNRDVAAVLHDSNFDVLANRFDAVIYGDDPATSADTFDARQRWPKVLDGAGRG